ncbi:hypothetical protein OIU84_019728 [Salix udensis]|uniref:EIF3F/CSN6-like C-terminal domain-containing protein n=1 Tax=Salix udensis TaxID=889485 RepID=A0AAD6L1U6_9ROSI|nr:hypothetical protein OIU84_019728 [Salix udensis]
MQERFLIDVFNLLPNLNVADLIKAFAVKTNDMMLVIYLSSLIRSVVALHNLINNKMLNKEHEKAEDSKPVSPEFHQLLIIFCFLVQGMDSDWVINRSFIGIRFFGRVPRRSALQLCKKGLALCHQMPNSKLITCDV